MVRGRQGGDLHAGMRSEVERLAREGWWQASLADFPLMAEALGVSSEEEDLSMADLRRATSEFLNELQRRSESAAQAALDATRNDAEKKMIAGKGRAAARNASALLRLYLLSEETAGAAPWSKLPMTLAARQLEVGYDGFRPRIIKGKPVGRVWHVLEFLTGELLSALAKRKAASRLLRAADSGSHNGSVQQLKEAPEEGPLTPFRVEIINLDVEPDTVRHRQVVKLHYEVELSGETPVSVWLGASLISRDGEWFHDMARDMKTNVQPGIGRYVRRFRIPEAARPGPYRFVAALWYGPKMIRPALDYWDEGAYITVTS